MVPQTIWPKFSWQRPTMRTWRRDLLFHGIDTENEIYSLSKDNLGMFCFYRKWENMSMLGRILCAYTGFQSLALVLHRRMSRALVCCGAGKVPWLVLRSQGFTNGIAFLYFPHAGRSGYSELMDNLFRVLQSTLQDLRRHTEHGVLGGDLNLSALPHTLLGEAPEGRGVPRDSGSVGLRTCSRSWRAMPCVS